MSFFYNFKGKTCIWNVNDIVQVGIYFRNLPRHFMQDRKMLSDLFLYSVQVYNDVIILTFLDLLWHVSMTTGNGGVYIVITTFLSSYLPSYISGPTYYCFQNIVSLYSYIKALFKPYFLIYCWMFISDR